MGVRLRTVAAVMAVVGLSALALGGVAGAQEDGNTIHACYHKNSGALRVVDADATCRNPELPLSWNRTGPAGPSGPSGPRGPSGSQGASGPSGPAGPSGPQGQSGSSGSQGPSGASGPLGTSGPSGSSGPQGPSGASGPLGTSGPSGPSGPQGPSGASGPLGTSGPSGPAGQGALPNWTAYLIPATESPFDPVVQWDSGFRPSLMIRQGAGIVSLIWSRGPRASSGAPSRP